MKALGNGLLTAAIAIFAFPSVATAQYLVPPGNSAVNQYTESVPTAGGQKNVGDGPKGDRGDRSPSAVLGAENARRLEERGPAGRKAAEVAAATAPATGVTVAPATGEGEGEGGVGAGSGRGGSDSGQGGGASGPGQAADPAPTGAGEAGSAGGGETDGSSAFGEVLSQATGTASSGQLGLLLPFAILAAAAWALAFLRRERKRPTT